MTTSAQGILPAPGHLVSLGAGQTSAEQQQHTSHESLATLNLDNFMRDGMEFESLGANHNGIEPAHGGAPRCAPLGPSTAGAAAAAADTVLHNMTTEELNQILNLETGSLDLEVPLPDLFSGAEGDELLGLEFANILNNDVMHGGHGGGQQQQQHVQQQHPAPVREASNMADAARSVLASLDASLPHASGATESGVAPMSPGGPVSSQNMVGGNGGGGVRGAQSPSANPAPLLGYTSSASMQFNGQQQGGQYYHPAPPQMLQGGPIYVDAHTGQILHVTHSHPMMSQWPGGGGGGGGMPGAPHMMAMQPGHHAVQYLVQQPHPGSPVSGMHIMHGMPSMIIAGPPEHAVPAKKSPAKRRRSRATAETVSQRSARAEQGYTYDPVTGKMYRHGPALLASARDNKEVPVVKSLFSAFNQNGGFAGHPPVHHAGPQQPQVSNGTFQGLPPLAPLMNNQAGVPGQPMQQGSRRPDSPGPSTSSSHLLVPEPNVPSGRQLGSGVGHGFITSLVTRELQSSAPGPGGAAANGALAGGAGADGIMTDAEHAMLGVTRDKWSLFWDAYVAPTTDNGLPDGTDDPAAAAAAAAAAAGPSIEPSILQGFRQEAIYLGKFPSRDQAGRAHDIAALKLHGESAVTNFPRENYTATLPVLAAHSEDEVVAALKKDSELALQRTSKYKGVRRTAPGQYEARVDGEVVARGDGEENMGVGPVGQAV